MAFQFEVEVISVQERALCPSDTLETSFFVNFICRNQQHDVPGVSGTRLANTEETQCWRTSLRRPIEQGLAGCVFGGDDSDTCRQRFENEKLNSIRRR